MIIQIKPENIQYNKKMQGLCTAIYYNHPKGCPNYGEKEGCPPNQPLINDILNFKKNIYLIYTEFEIGKHARKMKQLHPDWSERQTYNCRLWQPKARKAHRQEVNRAKEEYNLIKIVCSPEAHGVNLTDLFKSIGVKLEWPPRKITRLASLGGYDSKKYF